MKADEIIVGENGNHLIAMDGDSVPELEFAGYCAMYLTKCYPGHPWPVEAHITPDGMDIRIRHWAMAKFGPYCYHIAPQDANTYESLHKSLMIGGGEILDRLGFPRVGDWDGSIPETLEDTDQRFHQKVYV